MSTKQTDAVSDSGMLEVRLHGPGAVTIGLFDAKGRALIVRRLLVSGPQDVEARSHLPRIVQTRNGAAAIIPVLMHRSNDRQRVTFAGREAAAATAEKCREMNLSKAILGKIQATTDVIASRGGDVGAMLSVGATTGARKR